jgi:menaquinone-9 beta-reductase
MGSTMESFDVAVVGASVAGCTAARLFAQRGARVALIERRNDPAAYKVTCTHAILPSATPTMERLGLAPLLRDRGAVQAPPEVWTRYGGWMCLPDDAPDGWGVTRRTLDPILRDLTVGTPGVELLAGWTAREVVTEGGRPVAVAVEDRGHRRRVIRAHLLVAADGRDSGMARLARVPGRVRPHDRFFYFAYWRGVRSPSDSLRLWLLEPDGAAEFPNEDGITLLVTSFHRSRLAGVRGDLEGSYMRHLASLTDGPGLEGAERVSKILGKLETPNVIRPAARPGIAFVGDAALATDPVFGVGIGFAFQSAEWLVDATSGALDDRPRLDRGLRRYARRFLWRLAPHHLLIADFSNGRDFRPVERFVLRRAAQDLEVARAIGGVLVRDDSPFRLLDPRFPARLLLRGAA